MSFNSVAGRGLKAVIRTGFPLILGEQPSAASRGGSLYDYRGQVAVLTVDPLTRCQGFLLCLLSGVKGSVGAHYRAPMVGRSVKGIDYVESVCHLHFLPAYIVAARFDLFFTNTK